MQIEREKKNEQSQSLRKSGRLFRHFTTDYQSRAITRSQSLRKSGRLFQALKRVRRHFTNDLQCRNPFVNQVVCFIDGERQTTGK